MTFIDQPVRERGARQILEIEDVVLRNLWITQAYHELSNQFTAFVGERDNTWCTFGTWGSNSVGGPIRYHDLVDRIERRLEGSAAWRRGVEGVNRWLIPLRVLRMSVELREARVVAGLDAMLEKMSRQLAEGNRFVFAEIGPLFGRYLDVLDGLEDPDAAVDPAPLVDAVSDVTNGANLERLARTLDAYDSARRDPDRRRRAEVVLFGNLLAAEHEQARLQDILEAAVDVPVDHAVVEPLRRGILRLVPLDLLRVVLSRNLGRLDLVLEQVWRRLAGEFALRVVMPDVALTVGDDVPPLPGQSGYFPRDLVDLRDADLIALVERYDRSDGAGGGSAAIDWVKLGDRMNFITNLFRSRQQHAALRTPPFTDADRGQLEQGLVPEGFAAVAA